MTLGQMLIQIYGEDARKLFQQEYKEMVKYSNCQEDFKDEKYMQIAAEFACEHLEEMIKGDRSKQTMKALVCSSFGEAAMYKYNIFGGNIN